MADSYSDKQADGHPREGKKKYGLANAAVELGKQIDAAKAGKKLELSDDTKEALFAHLTQEIRNSEDENVRAKAVEELGLLSLVSGLSCQDVFTAALKDNSATVRASAKIALENTWSAPLRVDS